MTILKNTIKKLKIKNKRTEIKKPKGKEKNKSKIGKNNTKSMAIHRNDDLKTWKKYEKLGNLKTKILD